MSEKFKKGDLVMTKKGKGEVMHFLPDTFTVTVKLETTGHMISLPSFEVEKIQKEKT